MHNFTIALVAVAAAATIAGCSAPTPKVDSSPKSSAPSSEPAATELATTARDGKFEFEVLDINTAPSVTDASGYLTETAQGTYVIVTMSVRNIGDRQQSYFGNNQKLVDVTGRQYGTDTTATVYANPSNSVLGEINPGNSIEAKAVFDVPAGTRLSALEVHDSMLSGGAKLKVDAQA
uniref:DUF4352 domain-containing protein n=1 Tax=Mycobacterium phage Stink TaxID=3136630 RepID=A0AAU8GPC5_9VIRU